MSLHYQQFKDLHQAKELFVLPNAWNAESALLLQQNGFKAIATSSAAVAKSLGYEDGEGMPFEEYLFIVKRISSSIKLPLTVDLEMGYGSTGDEIYANISRLAEIGVVGINLEDSQINKSKRTLQDASSFAKKLSQVKDRLEANNIALFINVRCDTYLLNVEDKQQETARRARLYRSSGADGIFLPCILKEEDIRSAVACSDLPLNVMAFQGLPGFATLTKLGVKRVSLGPFLFMSVYDHVKRATLELMKEKDISVLF